MSRTAVGRLIVATVPALAVATLVVAILQDGLGIDDPSAVYLVAVTVAAFLAGTPGGVLASVLSFLLYDFLFVDPRYTFTVADPSEWLHLVLLLFVGIVVGQLTALQRARAEDARAREREARALFSASRTLATRETSAEAALPAIVSIVRDAAGLERVWVALGADDARARIVADTGTGPVPEGPIALVLQRKPGSVPAEWVRVHRTSTSRGRRDGERVSHRVWLEAGGERLGWLGALTGPDAPTIGSTDTRLLSATADQAAQAVRQDRLAAEAREAEIARQSDELKSALLQSVSHDLRTPLAAIRAAAGSLRPGLAISEADRNETVDTIEGEVDYLNRLVTNLLDLSRIEAGVLRAEREPYHIDDLLSGTIQRARGRLRPRPLEVDLAPSVVLVDPILLDEAVTNILENAAKYAPPDAPVRVRARRAEDGLTVRLTIEDGGSGVPDDQLPRIFEKFYRVPGRPRSSRSGTGVGLAVVRGVVEAMGGRVTARRSELGGLAVDLDLPAAGEPHRLDLSAGEPHQELPA